MADNIKEIALVRSIDTNHDKNISRDELEKAPKTVPSIWLEQIGDMMDGKESISVDNVLTGLVIEHSEPDEAENIDEQSSGNNNNSGTSAQSDYSKSRISLFTKIDTDKDGKISREELQAAGYKDNELIAMSQVLFFAERDVNKWFMQDKTKDGTINNAESELWDQHNTDDFHKNGDMALEEFAAKNGITIDLNSEYDNFEEWCKHWIEKPDGNSLKELFKERCGRELSDEETELLYDAMKYQANRWLFKQDSLYERLNNSAYTRLITADETESCCGGDISQPPMGSPRALNENGEVDTTSCGIDRVIIFDSMAHEDSINDAVQTKNRLAWAAFKTVTQKEAAQMTPEEYSSYKQEWEAVRNMKASDYRALLLPENRSALEKFEANSNMTVKQIVEYIDIVESTTGKDFDSDDWSIDRYMFNTIQEKTNGTYGEEKILEGKTRADIPPERLEWLKYLESHGLLLEQFKE